MRPNDMPDRRLANATTVNIGHLQHSQDHRLTTDEQQSLTQARGVLLDLLARIDHEMEV